MHFTKEVSPIYHFFEEYARKSGSRLHMPGHFKGRVDFYRNHTVRCFLRHHRSAGCRRAIRGRRDHRAVGSGCGKLYGVKETCLSAGGSTLSIMAMVAVASEFTKKFSPSATATLPLSTPVL